MMPLTLIRRPRSARRMKRAVRDEVRKSLQSLSDVVIGLLNNTVADWESKPKFTVKVSVTDERWIMEAKVNRREKIGKIWTWIDVGVGEYGGKEHLPDITPKQRRGKKQKLFLGFTVPHNPKTLPNPPVPGIPSSDPQRFIRAKSVRHPGIYPRRFSAELTDWLKSKRPGAFRSVIEAAVKRAYYNNRDM